MQSRLHYLLFLALISVACDAGLDGIPRENQAPTTNFTVNSINLPEGQRLTSQITISWWGDDPDGYVVGYEFYIGDDVQNNSPNWVFTTRTDSTFVLPIPEGNLDADVMFTVRAIDNEDTRDPNPPSLVFPIRNSPPNVLLVTTELPPDTTYRVFSFGFRATDPDGNANLNRIEFAINDTTTWNRLNPQTQLLTFRTDDTNTQAVTQVFTGRTAARTDITLQTVRPNETNTFYIRAIDNAGAVSPIRTHSWHVKKQTSNVLFFNDYSGPNSRTVANLHLQLLESIGITNVDYVEITDGLATGGRRVPLSRAFPDRSLAAPTTNMMMAEWDHIYWVSEDLDRNIGYALEMTLQFFENGGTMFVNIPTKSVQDDNPLLEFLPFERIQTPPPGRTFFIANNTTLSATQEADEYINQPGTSTTVAPNLRFRRNQTSLFPVVPFGETIKLFEAEFQTRVPFPPSTTPFDGPRIVSAVNPNNSLLFFGIDLTEFDREERQVGTNVLPASDLTGLIRLTCVDILKFEQ
jgi:hypothetical protein